MKYLIISLLNAIYGLVLLFSVTPNSSGVTLVLFIGTILALLGIIGFALWIWHTITSIRGQSTNTENILKSWWQIAKGIDVLLVFGLLFRFFVLQPFMVEGNSMEPNYHDKEYLLVNQMTYRLRSPQRGETIIFKFPINPQEDYIKRIIGLPGETVKISEGKVFINNKMLIEDFLTAGQQTNFGGGLDQKYFKTLGENEYFVMGDNRDHSSDSRDWGILPKKNIIGRAWWIIYPLKYRNFIHNPALNFSI
ncbi:MAG: putative signal peptidase signal peptidase [Candidatus Berkelbacteria bacterium]|nr:putative signal peptidase signal peptidase [Candidatus Berkelbacteria bacterium]